MSDGSADKRMIIMCVGMCVLSFVVYLLVNLCSMGDTYLFLIATMLSTVGIMITTSLGVNFGFNNMKMYLGGVALFFITILLYRLFYKLLRKFVYIYFAISVALYVITLAVAEIMETELNGAKNWLPIGEFSFQPSEFIKILFVMTIAGILSYNDKKDSEKPLGARITSTFNFNPETHFISRRVLLITAVTYINIIFLFTQTELGTAVLLFAVYIAFLFVYERNGVLLIVNTAIMLTALTVMIVFPEILPSYLETRIEGWLDPFGTRDAGGNYIVKSLTAIQRGGFTGVGLGNANFNIKEFETVISDYVFAAVCKEMGILGGIAVLLLYFVLVYRGFKIAVSTTNSFNKAVAFGLSTMLGVQTFIIIGGVTRMIPLTGITLPFISHGGSSMFSTFIAIGMLQAISSVKGDTTDEIE